MLILESHAMTITYVFLPFDPRFLHETPDQAELTVKSNSTAHPGRTSFFGLSFVWVHSSRHLLQFLERQVT